MKIYDSALMSSSQYKCILTSEQTTADELLAILLHCYDSNEGVERFSLYEVSVKVNLQLGFLTPTVLFRKTPCNC